MSETDQPSAPIDAESDAEMSAQVATLLAARGDSVEQRSLISLLQAVQQEVGFLPREAMLAVADFLKVSPAHVYGVATFYNQFRFTPPGRHQIKVCMGTACAIKLGGVILDSWQRRLDLSEGETSADREYSLERVACVGCCSMAPVTVVGQEVHGDMSPTKVDGILLRHQMARDKVADEEVPE